MITGDMVTMRIVESRAMRRDYKVVAESASERLTLRCRLSKPEAARLARFVVGDLVPLSRLVPVETLRKGEEAK